MVITLIIESDNVDPTTGQYVSATQADTVTWSNQYNLTFPVLADPDNTGWNYIQTDPSVQGGYGLPSTQLLGPGLEVLKVNSWIQESDFLPYLDPE